MSLDDLIRALTHLRDANVAEQMVRIGLTLGLEPATAFTDAVLAAWTAFLAARLLRRSAGLPVRLWGWAFVAAALSSLAGVAYHGCRILLSPSWIAASWKAVPVTTAVAACCLGSAATLAWLRGRTRSAVIAILMIECVACFIAAYFSNSFLVAAADYLPVLLYLLAGSLVTWQQASSRFIVAGVIVSFLAFSVQASSLRLSALDHNDIFHVVQCAAMYLLYRGGDLLQEKTAPAEAPPSRVLAATVA
jgi:hypothetical protein